jgi:hypothetical protein
LLARLRSHQSVIAVSAGQLPPNGSFGVLGAIEFGDRPGEKTKDTFLPVFEAWPGYFAAAGISLLEGREFRPDEVDPVAIVSADFAATHWPGGSALGRRFQIGKQPWRTIVGVSREVRQVSEDDDSKSFELYYPPTQLDGVLRTVRPASTIAEYLTIVLRAERPGAIAGDLTAAIHGVDPRVIVSGVHLVAHDFADAIARPRIVLLLMFVFAGAGLLLAAAGLYGVLSYLVLQRQREIGIRLALGATPAGVRRAILGSGLGLTVLGALAGAVVTIPLDGAMRALFYDVEPIDPL